MEEKLAEYLKINLTPIKFIKTKEGNYNFGTKKVAISLVNNKLICD